MPTASPIRRMTSPIDSSTAMNWLGIAIRPFVAKTAVIASSSGTQRRDRGAEHEQEDDQREREGDHRGRREHARERRVGRLGGRDAAELADREAVVRGRGLVDRVR